MSYGSSDGCSSDLKAHMRGGLLGPGLDPREGQEMPDVGRRDHEIPVRGLRVEVLIRRQSLRVYFEGIRDGARDRHRHSSRLETLAGAHKQRIVEIDRKSTRLNSSH